MIYGYLRDNGEYILKLFNVDPSVNLKKRMEQAKSTTLFSATLLPIQYYKELLGGEKTDYEVYAHSVFPAENRGVMVARDVTSKYTRRGAKEYERIAEYLHDMLKIVDPKAAEEIHFNNVKRVIRALEFFHQTGSQISAHNESERQKESPYEFFYFVLNDDRAKLYERIDMRVDMMMEAGLVEEVKKLLDMGCTRDMVSMQGLGYKEIIDYLQGNISLEEAVYVIKRDTRHFAKRQLTWFRRERDVRWVNKSDFASEDEILEYILAQMEGKEE